MTAALTPGQASDYTGYPDTVDDELPPARVLIADKGYDSAPIRETVKAEGGTPVIPPRRNRTEPEPIDGVIHALRNRIERCINRLENARRLATRYDKTAASFLAFVQMVSPASGSGICQHDLGGSPSVRGKSRAARASVTCW